ncbi:MAG: tetratricopeptide repeat protein [Acidobacteriota bacterium]|nr:tetratricopeptide repeat protein [Acidobacteriota bacterium]
MLKKIFYAVIFLSIAFISIQAQTVQKNDTVMVLPFENTSGKPEFNWVGESLADSLSGLLKVPSLNVISNQERKIIQQRLHVPLTVLPSLATSLKLAREAKTSLLIAGKYNIVPAQGDAAATVNVTARIIRVNEGRFLSEDFSDGKRRIEIVIADALANLQTVEGQVAFQILYQRDKALPFKQNDFIETANKVPARAFEAYIKGLLTPESDAQTRENYFKNAMRLYGETRSGETYADAALELGHFYLNQKKYNDAVEYFSRVPAENSQYAEAAFYTGLIQWQQNNYEQALAVLRPLAEDLKLTNVYNTLGAIAVQASLVEKKNKGAKSDTLLKEGLDYLKKASDSAPDELNARFNYGLALFLNNNFADAAQQLRPVLAVNSRDGESYFILAKALAKTGDASAADFDNQARRFLTENNRYAKLESDWSASRFEGINLRVEQPARKDFVSVILIKKQAAPTPLPLNETETLLEQARTLYKNGSDDEAMTVLRKILVSEPMSAEAYNLLGMIHLRRGDLEQSVSSLKTALFWDNRLISAHVSLGKIYLQKGDCLQAKNYVASALAIDAENQDATGLQRQVERCGK